MWRSALLPVTLLACSSNAPTEDLKLKEITLYETGLGYYVRAGHLGAGALAYIPLEPGQLDDALKTLVVVSETGVASVEYNPPLAPQAARAQAGLPQDDGNPNLANLLLSLRGVNIRLVQDRDNGTTVEGRLMSVQLPDPEDTQDKQSAAVMVLGKNGLMQVPLERIVSVLPLDPWVHSAWDRAVAANATEVASGRVCVRGTRQGGNVAVGYTTEAPVWTMTYRVVLSDQHPRLQAFAVVHNASSEPWDGVKVTLVSGQPTSFLYPMAGPRYGRRELVEREDGFESAPQLATQEAKEHLLGEADVEEEFETGGRGSGVARVSAGCPVTTLGGRGRSREPTETTKHSSLLADGPTPIEPAAVSEAGDLFLYAVQEPVNLPPRRSALLPVVDSTVAGERVTLVDDNGHTQLSVRLANSTPMTLEGGVVTVFVDGAYAGECQVDRIKPGEIRVLAYAEDLDVAVERSTERVQGPAKVVRRVDNAIEIHGIDKLVHRVTATSRTDKPRTLLLHLPQEDFAITEGATEDVRSPGQPRLARVSLAPRNKSVFTITEESALVTTLTSTDMDPSRLDELLGSPHLDATVRAALVAARADAVRAEDAEARERQANQQVKSTTELIDRLRANLEAAGKGGAKVTAETLAQRLLSAESQLERLKVSAHQADVDAYAARRALLDRIPVTTH